MHEATATRVMTKALIPNTEIETRKAGLKAINTSYINLLEVLSECTCGEADMMILSSDILIF